MVTIIFGIASLIVGIAGIIYGNSQRNMALKIHSDEYRPLIIQFREKFRKRYNVANRKDRKPEGYDRKMTREVIHVLEHHNNGNDTIKEMILRYGDRENNLEFLCYKLQCDITSKLIFGIHESDNDGVPFEKRPHHEFVHWLYLKVISKKGIIDDNYNDIRIVPSDEENSVDVKLRGTTATHICPSVRIRDALKEHYNHVIGEEFLHVHFFEAAEKIKSARDQVDKEYLSIFNALNDICDPPILPGRCPLLGTGMKISTLKQFISKIRK